MGNVLTSKLEFLKEKIDKKAAKQKPSGIDKYIQEESDSGDSFEDAQGDFSAGALMDKQTDPSKLIDLELINLLKYCYSLTKLKDNDDY